MTLEKISKELQLVLDNMESNTALLNRRHDELLLELAKNKAELKKILSDVNYAIQAQYV